jgi:ribokinase|tara:strand:- start:714 stop:1613 length:900 start_codon:yes stop_codon:yes gene_type:complete
MVDPVIIGTVALDSIKTPFGKVDDALGGSACYASLAASFFSKPGILSIIGKDFPKEFITFLNQRSIDTNGIVTGDKTFKWKGYYEFDMNEAKTLDTELNSLLSYNVEVPDQYKDAKYIFLANIDPELQLKVINEIKNPELIVMDTMNFWIDNKKKELLETIKKADILVFNDGEARQLFETPNLVTAAKAALKLVSKAVIIKKGEHGALLFTKDKHFSAPGYPLEKIKDPTGCGDCFGGAFTGYLSKTKDLSEKNMRKAIVYGSVIASYNAEDFGTERLKNINMEDIEKRFDELKSIREF